MESLYARGQSSAVLTPAFVLPLGRRFLVRGASLGDTEARGGSALYSHMQFVLC